MLDFTPVDAIVDAYSYIRFSSLPQQYGDSVRRQKEGSEALAKRMGWRLDTSLKIDKGRSAYTGENASVGVLAAFLEMCEGKNRVVKPGSILIVESLDRLTRQKVMDAVRLFQNILHAGVKIATVQPERIYSWESINAQPFELMEIVLIFVRANEESAMKSKRGNDAWQQKRRNLDSKILTGRIPLWCHIANKKIACIPGRKKTLNHIFDLAISGLGALGIARKLNQEGVEPFIGKGVKMPMAGAYWTRNYVNQLLNDRRVIGEFQPLSHGKPVGQPVLNYYPEAVSLEKWYKSQAALKPRSEAKRNNGGRRGQNVNLFKNLIKDTSGANLWCQYKVAPTTKKKHYYLISSASVDGKTKWMSIDYHLFEKYFFEFVNEIQDQELWAEDAVVQSTEGEIEELKAIIKERTFNIDRIKQRMLAGEYSDEITDLVIQLEQARKGLQKQLESLQAEQKQDVSQDLKEVKNITPENLTDPEMRERVQTKLKKIVREIWVKVSAKNMHSRRIFAQVYFTKGGTKLFQLDYNSQTKEVHFGSASADKLEDLGIDIRTEREREAQEEVTRTKWNKIWNIA